MTVLHHSSRRDRADVSLLNARLIGAVSHDQIAGYVRSSLLEVAGEAIENVAGKVRVVCNSDPEPADVETAKAAQQAMWQSWSASEPEELAVGAAGRSRFSRLFDLLASGKLEVRVTPEETFDMIDTVGYGIHEMHIRRARRYLPMPDYDLSEPQAVKSRIRSTWLASRAAPNAPAPSFGAAAEASLLNRLLPRKPTTLTPAAASPPRPADRSGIS